MFSTEIALKEKIWKQLQCSSTNTGKMSYGIIAVKMNKLHVWPTMYGQQSKNLKLVYSVKTVICIKLKNPQSITYVLCGYITGSNKSIYYV